mmetsp:Transcript_2427/g.2817  ORF Transcript_2427/g.2817 Transcript_2427/m.2817 type:complete len:87 (+) Transcript_2427:461-721(+)
MEKEFDKNLDVGDDHSAADSDDVDSEYALQCRPDKVQKYDLRWTDEYSKYLKGHRVSWKEVMLFGDQMFILNNGIVYADSDGVPCD